MSTSSLYAQAKTSKDSCSASCSALSARASWKRLNAAAVAKHHGVKAFIHMSQRTVSQMSITETTPSPQQKLHWLAEQALNWSGLPVVNVRPTMMLEGSLLILTPDSVRESN